MNTVPYILIPAHNEASKIAQVIGDVRKTVPNASIIVIDDGSQDTTVEEALRAGATVLSLPFNLGYGTALQTGYKYCLQHNAQWVVQLDGDGQHEPADIPRVLAPVQANECDLCLGSRFLEGNTYPIPLARRLGMFLFRRIATFLLRTTITDPTSGFQAMNQKTLRFFCHDIYPVDYPDTDVLVLLHQYGFKIREVPVTMYASPDGPASMHAGFRPAYYLFKMALTIPFNLIRCKKERENIQI